MLVTSLDQVLGGKPATPIIIDDDAIECIFVCLAQTAVDKHCCGQARQ